MRGGDEGGVSVREGGGEGWGCVALFLIPQGLTTCLAAVNYSCLSCLSACECL